MTRQRRAAGGGPLLALAFAAAGVAAGSSAFEIPPEWTAPVEPFRIVGPIHYVGTQDLAAFLIVGSAGHVLLDTTLDENVPLVLGNVEKLGFRVGDVEVLLNSHAHFDHCAGLARAKERTGATLWMSAADAELAARGGKGDFAWGDSIPYPPVTADRVALDGTVVRLGDLALTAHLTPGHTKGCTTWTTAVRDGERTLTVAFLCSVSSPGYRLVDNDAYPEIRDDYRRTFAKLRALRPDVFLAAHASFFDLAAKLERRRGGDEAAFVDPEGWVAHLAEKEAQLERRVAEQEAGAGD